jgi:hypothetical protein
MADGKTFFLVSEALYCHGLGKIVVDGRPERGRCRFFDLNSDFGLRPTFSGCEAMMSVSLADLFFLFPQPSSCCSVQDVSLSIRLSVRHYCWLLAFIFLKPLT